MASFCIVRCEKLKTRGNLAASIAHTFRTSPTDNADPGRRHLNDTVGGTSKDEIFKALDRRLEAADARRVALFGRHTSKTAVQSIEYLITASPESMAAMSEDKIDAFMADVRRWLVERHGAENVLSTTVHRDEGSPHLSAYVVPVGPKGTLDAASWTNKRALSQLQTDFHRQVGVRYDLERGIQGSKAKHERVARHYGLVNSETPAIVTPRPAAVADPTPMEKLYRSTRHADELAAAAKQQKKRSAEAKARDEVLVAKAKQLEIDRGKLAAREAQLRDATFAREIPLTDVMLRLGCTRDTRDKSNWETPAGRISIGRGDDLSKFYNHDEGKGGGGAIDLVMHVEGVDFKTAKRWLLDAFGGPALVGQLVAQAKAEVEQLKSEPRPSYGPPAPAPGRWPRVRAYLVDVRRLAARLIDALHDVGRIYADARSNAVFQLGPKPGVELRGIGESKFKGVRGAKGVFDLAADGGDRRVAMVESSIEAMSLRCLGFKGRVLGYAGSSPELQEIHAAELLEHGFEVFAAFNNDAAGDRMAAALIATAPTVRRWKPALLKDWNAELVARRASEEATGMSLADRPDQADVERPDEEPTQEHP